MDGKWYADGRMDGMLDGWGWKGLVESVEQVLKE